jgi:hypothetical protein
MENPRPLRRLPWCEDGKPVYLSADTDGLLSRIADDIEARQIQSAAQVLALATPMLALGQATPPEATWIARRLGESLRDALAVAESRGVRLGIVDGEAELH